MDFSKKPKGYLSVKEFGAVVGWGDDTTRRLIQRNVIRAIALPQANASKRVHRRIRIPESEVTRFARLHSVG